MSTYLIYVDDSGDEDVAVYTALLVPTQAWTRLLREWLQFRRKLYADQHIPADYELHAVEFIREGRGRPAPTVEFGVNASKQLRRKVLRDAVEAVGALPELRVVSHVAPGATPAECYAALVGKLEQLLEDEEGWGVMVVDGDGVSQPYLQRTHRGLDIDSRRILEDAWSQGAHISQLVQMADLTAYALHQAHKKRPSKKFMWAWYADNMHSLEPSHLCACPQDAERPR